MVGNSGPFMGKATPNITGLEAICSKDIWDTVISKSAQWGWNIELSADLGTDWKQMA